MMIKELTASVFIVGQDVASAWQTALIWHSRMECWLPAGGHVEPGETAAQAAVREAAEATGLTVTLVPGPAAPYPAGFPHQAMPAPWWTAELPAAFSELGHFSAGHASRQARMQPPMSSAAAA